MTDHPDETEESDRIEATEADDSETEDAAETREERPRKGGRGLAAFALFLGLAAVGVAGWAGWQVWQQREARGDPGVAIQDLSQRLERLGAAVEELRDADGQSAASVSEVRDLAGEARREAESVDDRHDQLRATVQDLSQEIASLQADLSDQAGRIEDIAARLDGLQGGGAPNQGIRLVEAESLIRTAYRLLELERDPQRAARALTLAAGQLEGLSAPGLTRVREAVARELEAVRAVEPADRAGLAARLAALADRTATLPLREDWGPGGFTGRPADAAAETGEDGWWRATRDFLGEYFTVRRTDEAGTALPDPTTLRLMREVLRLELEQARMAVLRGEAELYRQSLERAATLLEQYFATDSQAVQSAGEAIGALLETEVAPPLPEHGAALEALRSITAREGTG